MSKIGDLFVRLGLKKDDFSQGLDEAGRELQGFEAKTNKMSIAAKAAWAAVAAAVVKFAKDSIEMTQRWGDQFAVAMEGAKGAYGALVRQLSSGEGFDNLFANMRNAAIAARQMAADLDELFERKISSNYAIAQAEKEIAQWTLTMNDASKSEAERKAAADAIIAKEKEIGDLKRGIAQQEADAYRRNFTAQTGLNDEQLDFLLKEYNANRDLINQSREYLAEQKRLQAEVKATSGGGILGEQDASTIQAIEARHKEALANLQALESNTSDGIKNIAALTQKYDKSSDELVEKLAAADVAVIQIDTDVMRASSRANRMLGTLGKATGGSQTDSQMQAALAIQKAAEQSQKTDRQIIEETYRANVELFKKLGLDTTALTAQYADQVIAALNRESEEMKKELVAVAEVEMPPIDMSHVDDEINEWVENFNKTAERAKDIVRDFSQAVAGGFTDACQELAGQLFGLEEMNAGAIIRALLTPLADMAIKMGEIIVAEGIAMEAAKKAFTNPFTAIAAGAALIAIGAAAKAGLEAVARGGSATTTAATSAYGGGGTGGTMAAQEYNTEMTIHVEGRLSGSDIVLSGERTLNSWNR